MYHLSFEITGSVHVRTDPVLATQEQQEQAIYYCAVFCAHLNRRRWVLINQKVKGKKISVETDMVPKSALIRHIGNCRCKRRGRDNLMVLHTDYS